MKEITLNVRKDSPILDGYGLSTIETLIKTACGKSHGMDYAIDMLVKEQKSTDPGTLLLTLNRACELLHEISVLLDTTGYILSLDTVSNTYDVLEDINDKLKENE